MSAVDHQLVVALGEQDVAGLAGRRGRAVGQVNASARCREAISDETGETAGDFVWRSSIDTSPSLGWNLKHDGLVWFANRDEVGSKGIGRPGKRGSDPHPVRALRTLLLL